MHRRSRADIVTTITATKSKAMIVTPPVLGMWSICGFLHETWGCYHPPVPVCVARWRLLAGLERNDGLRHRPAA